MIGALPSVLDVDAVAALLPKIDVLATLRDMFRELADGTAAQPAQSLTLFPNASGDFIAYLGVLGRRGVFGVKLSPYIVTGGKPIITAWTQLMSMASGQPLLLCNADQLTVERTGGATALAVDHLARPDARRLAIIGRGAVAAAHWKHVRELRKWEMVEVWAPSLSSRANPDGAWWTNDSRISVARDCESACRSADVVLLCTSSAAPVIDPSWLRRDALVTSISTNAFQAHEVPPSLLRIAEVYCDYRMTTPHAAGEMALAARDFHFTPAAVRGDLPELVAGRCPAPSGDAPVFFRSIGLGLEDIAMAEALLRVARPDQSFEDEHGH